MNEDCGFSEVKFLHDGIEGRVSEVDTIDVAEEAKSGEFELVEAVLVQPRQTEVDPVV